jgi:hypothetical protein
MSQIINESALLDFLDSADLDQAVHLRACLVAMTAAADLAVVELQQADGFLESGVTMLVYSDGGRF